MEATIPEAPSTITKENLELLRAWVMGSSFSVYNRLIENEIISTYLQLEKAKDTHEIFRLQGRLNGLRYAVNAPVHLTKPVAPKPAAPARPPRKTKI